MTNIRDTIRRLAREGRQTVSLICTVDSVDKDNRTVDCSPIDESAPLLGVNLQANQGSDFGIVVYPRKDSYVVVGFVADGDAGVVLLTDDIESIEVTVSKDSTKFTIDENGVEVKVGDDVSLTMDKDAITAKNGDGISMEMTGSKIKFNGGNKKGIPLAEKVKEEINSIKDDLLNLSNTFSTAVTGYFMDTTGQTTTGNLASVMAAWQPNTTHIAESTIENTDIEQ